MSAYQSDEEQVEALKVWWKENGKSTIAGVVLGLGGLIGWQAWTQHQTTSAEQASIQYQQLTMALSTGATASAAKQAELLISQHEASSYAQFAALNIARQHLEQGDSAAAQSQLAWTLEKSSEPAIQQIARLRLARIKLSEGDSAGAAKLANEAPKDAFAGEFAQLRGDIALANSDKEAARKAYQAALENNVGNVELVQMKLDDLTAAVTR
ncbi:MAG: tetratricopeptide repeat protein [Candidatus Polarisedimenticolaceae bacterium]|nr:tetratricopeptide repeat protein [Candidatus Polarisedimenticolaceae bacterium]